MAYWTAIASRALAGALLLQLPTSAAGQAGSTAKSAALCLPSGVAAPVACGTVRPGQTIRLRIATTSLPTGPINLLFAEEAPAGQAPRTAGLTIPPTRSRDGGYEVTVPATLCGAGPGQAGQYEIQHLMSTYNQAETTRRSLGTLSIAC